MTFCYAVATIIRYAVATIIRYAVANNHPLRGAVVTHPPYFG
jgi:hypothetical protein